MLSVMATSCTSNSMFKALALLSVLGLACGDTEQATQNSASPKRQLPYGAFGSRDEELQKCYQHTVQSKCDEAVQKIESEYASKSKLGLPDTCGKN